MSKSEADHQDNAPDVITDSSSFPGESGVPAISGDAGEAKASSNDKFTSNRPFVPRNERYNKTPVYRPMRTSSAPPEEHGGGEIHKAHFQPTKTQQSFQSEQGRRPPYTNYSAGRGIPGRNFTSHREDTNSSPHHSGTGTETSSVNEASHVAQIGNDTPRTIPSSPVVVGSEGGLSVITASASTDTAGGGGGGSRPTHSPTASYYDRNSPHTSPLTHPNSGPVHHLRGSSSGNMGMGSGSSSPHTVGGIGGYNRDSPYNKTGDYRDSRDGNRDRMTAGRTNRRAQQQQQQSYTRGNNNSMGGQGQDQMGNRGGGGGGNYMNQTPVPMQQQGWQQQTSAAYTDAYGVPTMPQQGQPGMQQYGFQPVQASVPQGMVPQTAARQPHTQVMTHQQVPPQPQQQQQVMYGHMPQQQAPQQMMPVYPPQQQQYVFHQHPGQMYIQTPQGFMQQSVAYPPGTQQYNGIEYNIEAMIAHTIAEMQQMGMAPGSFFQIQLHPNSPAITVQIPPLPTQQYAQYQQQAPLNYPQQVQMQQQMHGQQQMQVPMYATQGSEMASYIQQQQQQGNMMHPMATAAGGQVQPPMQSGGIPQTQYASYNQGGVPQGQGQHFNQQAGHQGGPGTGPHGGQTAGPQRGPGYSTGGSRAQHPTQHSGSHDSPPARSYPQRAAPHHPVEHSTPSPAGSAPPVQPSASTATAVSTNAPSDTSAATGSSSTANEVPQVSAIPSEGATPAATTTTTVAPEPVKEPVPVVKERKVLSYKKKDGSTLDIMSFKEKHSEDTGSSKQSSSVSTKTESTIPAAGAASTADAVVTGNGNVTETTVPTTSTVAVVVADSAVIAPAKVATTIPLTPATTTTTETTADVKVTDPTAPVPTVHQQLQDLRMSPSQATPAPQADTPISPPPIKFGDLPVSLSAQPVTGYYPLSTTTPSIDVPSVPVSLPAAPEVVSSATATPVSRGKKASKKELLAKADAQAATSSDLSAYTDSASSSVSITAVSIPTAAAAVVQSVTSTPVLASIKSTPPTPALSTTTADALPDSWDDAAELNLPPAISNVSEGNSGKETTGSRSLRPGGKAGFSINLHQTTAVMRYTKQEIYNFRPVEKPPNPLGCYTVITTTEPSNSNNNNNTTPSGQKAGWSKRSSGQGGADGGHEGWKRDSNLPTPPPSSTGKHRKSSSTSIPMPKKVITDPIIQLSYDTMAILNKLTPQTFEKLSQKMLSLKVENISEMNKVIELIFEKAVQEQSFANLYAELCAYLNTKAIHWSFFTVVRIEPSNGECFWIREFSFPTNYAGPYYSLSECYNAVNGKDKPELGSVSVSLDVVECVLLNDLDLLIQILRNDKTSTYYLTYTPFDAVHPEQRSQDTFNDARSAQKDAKNKYNFRAKLVTNCQTEFQNTTMNESEYRSLEEELTQLNQQKHTLSEADYFYKSSDIEEKRVKLKRRMLGNIRFVGELFKQKLLTDVTIQACITDLMGSSTTSWKDMHDEQVIECLCHLLTTAGERLQSKVRNTPAEREFNQYFERLRYLSKDKSLNSRMRFAIEEVIALRDNDWQKRRETDGPVKLDVIQRRVQEQHSAASSSQYSSGAGGNRSGAGGFPPRGIPHAQPKQLLTRPRGGPAGGSGAQDIRKSSGGAGPAGGDRVSRSFSAMGNEHQHGKEPSGRPQGGEALRRAQSEYTPSSGTGTPTSVGSGHYPTASDSQHQRRSSEPSITMELSSDFSDKTLMNRSKSVVSEFLEQKDINEVKLFLSEGPAGTCGYLILQIIDKCLNDNKGAVQKGLLNMLSDDSLSEELRQSKGEVMEALRYCEELKCLVDITMDIKEAPEKFGSILAVLVKTGALTQEDTLRLTEEAKQNCIVELMSDEQDSAVIFDRFLKKFNTDITSNS